MKFGVREICDVVFKATADGQKVGNKTFSKGQPVLYIDTAKTSTLEGAATTVYAQGGKGNTRLLAWEGEKTLTFTVEDAMLSPLGFSVLTGAGLIESAVEKPRMVHTTLEVQAGAQGAIAITGEALGLVTGQKATVVKGDTAPIYGTVVDEAGAVIRTLGKATTLAADQEVAADGAGLTVDFNEEVLEGEIVILDFYVKRVTSVKDLEITADQFAGYYYVEASTLFRDQATGKDLPAEIIIPNAKIQSNFTFAMASTGDPSTFSFVMDAFPGRTKFSDKQVLATIQIIESEAEAAS